MFPIDWVLLVALSIWFAIAAFIWGFQSGQFSNQGRARYIVLADDMLPPPSSRIKKPTRGAYVLLLIFMGGVAIMAVALTMGIRSTP